MTDGIQSEDPGFGSIDPKLTMFALANGVDLSKSDVHRRLEWYSDGFERGILIELTDEGTFDIGVFKWTSGGADSATPVALHVGVGADEVVKHLDPAVESANGL
jgi:hypothetical protein